MAGPDKDRATRMQSRPPLAAGELEGSGCAPLEQDPSRRSVRALTTTAMPSTLLEPRHAPRLGGDVVETGPRPQLDDKSLPYTSQGVAAGRHTLVSCEPRPRRPTRPSPPTLQEPLDGRFHAVSRALRERSRAHASTWNSSCESSQPVPLSTCTRAWLICRSLAAADWVS
jgi:hypothetical protein